MTGSGRHELEALPALLDGGAGDRGYSSGAARDGLRLRGIGSVIPQPLNQRPRALVDWSAYRERNKVERLIGRLEQNRRVATRYERLAANYLAMVQVAAIQLWL